MDHKVEKLISIWEQIPNAVSEQLDFTQQELINRYMDAFHFGDFFYLIFNTRNTEMEYVHQDVEKLLGFKPETFSLNELLERIHPDDLPYYYHYEESAVRFFTKLHQDLFFSYKFSYDYRVLDHEGNYKRILQQIVPLYYFPEGGARTLAIFTDLTHLNIQGIPKLSFIGMNGAPSYYNVHLQSEFQLAKPIFTQKEKEILGFVIQGKNSEKIAEELRRSIFTIRTHRKNILKKSGCESVQELLVKSVREGWV